MKRSIPSIVSLALVLTTGMAQAESSPALVEDRGQAIEACMVESEINQAAAAIRSEEQLYMWLSTRDAGSHAFSRLGKEARARFIASLAWNEHGLTTFSYEPLEADLSLSEAYSVLVLFGAQATILPIVDRFKLIHKMDYALKERFASMECANGDRDGYHCKSRATCEKKMHHICKSNC